MITLARDLGYEVREENLVRTDLYNADECFFTVRRGAHADP